MLAEHQGGAWIAVTSLVLFCLYFALCVRLSRRRNVKCCAIGCKEQTVKPRLFCPAHWAKLPDEQRMMLVDAWDIDSSGRVHKRAYDFFMATVRAVNVLGIMEERISYEEAMHREEQSERAYRNQHGKDSD